MEDIYNLQVIFNEESKQNKQAARIRTNKWRKKNKEKVNNRARSRGKPKKTRKEIDDGNALVAELWNKPIVYY